MRAVTSAAVGVCMPACEVDEEYKDVIVKSDGAGLGRAS